MENESRKNLRSKAIRRLVIWYRRNSAVTSLVDTATNSASAASHVAGSVVSSAGSVVSSAGSIALNTLEKQIRKVDKKQNYDEKTSNLKSVFERGLSVKKE